MANLKKELLELSFAKPYHIAMKKQSLKFMLQEKATQIELSIWYFSKVSSNFFFSQTLHFFQKQLPAVTSGL